MKMYEYLLPVLIRNEPGFLLSCGEIRKMYALVATHRTTGIMAAARCNQVRVLPGDTPTVLEETFVPQDLRLDVPNG